MIEMIAPRKDDWLLGEINNQNGGFLNENISNEYEYPPWNGDADNQI